MLSELYEVQRREYHNFSYAMKVASVAVSLAAQPSMVVMKLLENALNFSSNFFTKNLSFDAHGWMNMKHGLVTTFLVSVSNLILTF